MSMLLSSMVHGTWQKIIKTPAAAAAAAEQGVGTSKAQQLHPKQKECWEGDDP